MSVVSSPILASGGQDDSNQYLYGKRSKASYTNVGFMSINSLM